MDIRYQGVVDEASQAKDLLVRVRVVLPFGEGLHQMVANRVVLERKKVVQEAQAQPPVRGQAGDLHPGGVDGDQLGFWIDLELALLAEAIRLAGLRTVAVDLR